MLRFCVGILHYNFIPLHYHIWYLNVKPIMAIYLRNVNRYFHYTVKSPFVKKVVFKSKTLFLPSPTSVHILYFILILLKRNQQNYILTSSATNNSFVNPAEFSSKTCVKTSVYKTICHVVDKETPDKCVVNNFFLKL